jgi:translation initiation factor 1
MCPTCGWPANDCKCSASLANAPVSGRITAKLRLEKKGRAGKGVTVVYDLPNNAAFLKDLCQEMKKKCGVGGTVGDCAIELQGDLRDRLRELLAAKGYVVKG